MKKNGSSGPKLIALCVVLVFVGRGARQWLAADTRADDAGSNTQAQPAGNGTPNPTKPDSTPAKPTSLLDMAFKVGHTMSHSAEVALDKIAGLTPAEEQQVGLDAHRIVRQKHRIVNRPDQLKRIRSLADPFLQNRPADAPPLRFFVIEDPNINAFAHVGGFIYVHTGLLKQIRDDEELRFVIGHEIAHCDLRHCVQSMTAIVRSQQTLGEFGGGLAALAYRGIAVGYSEQKEFAADEHSYRQIRKAGHSHARAVLGLQMLLRYDQQPDGTGRQKGLGDHVAEHFRTHPPVRERIRRLERLGV